MIRRNVASQTIYLPQLVLAADGAAVTSSATLTVAKDGTEASSAGTLAHVANGVWKYTPTQAETDAAIVGLILTGTLAVPVVLNLVTTAADTSAVALGANTTTPPTTADILAAASSNAATPPLERNIGDTNPVTFQWITDDATITAQRSINNAAYENVSGAIAFLRTDGTKHLYTLAYNAADRPPTNGTVRYAFTDGTYTRYLSLRISGANVVVPPTLSQLEARTLLAANYFQGGAVQSVTNPVTVGTNNDKSGYGLTSGTIDAIRSGLSTLTATQVWDHTTRSLSTFGTLVSDITTSVWSAGSRTLTSISDSAGITTLLNRITGLIRTKTEDEVVDTTILTALDNIDIDFTPVLEGVNDIKIKISSSVLQIISPVSSDGTSLTLIQGDDYLLADSRNITFTVDIEDQWPNLTGATVVFGINNTNILKEVSVVTPVGTQQLSLELTKEETSIPQGSYKYDVQATLSNGSVVTLFRGNLEVVKSYTN